MGSQLLLEIKGTSACQPMHYGGTEWVLSMESMLLALKVPRHGAQTPHWNLTGSLALIVYHLRPTTGLQQ